MKWIGQQIYDLVSRFRNDVYLEDISTGTIASGGNLGLDSNNKIVKATEASGDLTSIVAGTGLSGTSLTGPIPTLNVDAAQTQITSIGTITTGAWRGSVIESAYLDADTAHLSGTQTFSGTKTFSNTISGSIDGQAATVATIAGLAPNTATTQAAQANITSLGTLSSLAVTSASDLGSAAMTLTNADVDQIALDINASNTTGNIIDINATTLSSGNAIFIDSKNCRAEVFIDRDCNATGNQSHFGMMYLTGTKSSVTGSGSTHDMIGMRSEITDTATNVGTSNLTNLTLSSNMTNAGGTTKLHGISNTVAGASDDTVGLYSNVVNGSPDIKLVSSADATDYFTIATGAVGATTLTTVDTTVGATAHLDFAVDGQFSVASTGIDISGAGVISNATWQGTAIAIDQGGTGNTTGVQGGKNYRILNCSFRDDIGTTKHYLPFKSQDEQTVLTREEVSELAVCDGRVLSVTLRVENLNTHSGDATVTFGVETNVVGTGYDNFTEIETEAITVNNADDSHLYHAVFSTAKHWDSTDMFAISITSDVDISGNNERFFVTVVVEDDWSTYLAGSTREIDSTP